MGANQRGQLRWLWSGDVAGLERQSDNVDVHPYAGRFDGIRHPDEGQRHANERHVYRQRQERKGIAERYDHLHETLTKGCRATSCHPDQPQRGGTKTVEVPRLSIGIPQTLPPRLGATPQTFCRDLSAYL